MLLNSIMSKNNNNSNSSKNHARMSIDLTSESGNNNNNGRALDVIDDDELDFGEDEYCLPATQHIFPQDIQNEFFKKSEEAGLHVRRAFYDEADDIIAFCDRVKTAKQLPQNLESYVLDFYYLDDVEALKRKKHDELEAELTKMNTEDQIAKDLKNLAERQEMSRTLSAEDFSDYLYHKKYNPEFEQFARDEMKKYMREKLGEEEFQKNESTFAPNSNSSMLPDYNYLGDDTLEQQAKVTKRERETRKLEIERQLKEVEDDMNSALLPLEPSKSTVNYSPFNLGESIRSKYEIKKNNRSIRGIQPNPQKVKLASENEKWIQRDCVVMCRTIVPDKYDLNRKTRTSFQIVGVLFTHVDYDQKYHLWTDKEPQKHIKIDYCYSENVFIKQRTFVDNLFDEQSINHLYDQKNNSVSTLNQNESEVHPLYKHIHINGSQNENAVYSSSATCTGANPYHKHMSDEAKGKNIYLSHLLKAEKETDKPFVINKLLVKATLLNAIGFNDTVEPTANAVHHIGNGVKSDL